MPVDRDCGEHCAAFSLLTPELPLVVFGGEKMSTGIGLIYEANAEVWSTVQCTSVIDSNSANRACCACWEPGFCPVKGLSRGDSGYCGAACAAAQPSAERDLCRQLAAGCGVNTMTAHFDYMTAGQTRQCSESEIQGGQCALCRQPQWCDDPTSMRFAFGRTRTTSEWMNTFYSGSWTATRQCKYKQSQRAQLVATAREYHRRRQRDQQNSAPSIENEVNVYVNPDGSTEATLNRHLIALVFFRTTGNRWSHIPVLKRLRAHLRALGHAVPLLAVTNEKPGDVTMWRHDKVIRLSGTPYNLEVLEA